MLLAAAAARADEEPRLSDLPLESKGQLRFAVDVSGYRSATDGLSDLEVYVSLSNDQLEFRPVAEGEGEGLSARIMFAVSVRDTRGEEVFVRETPLEPQARSELDAADRAILQLLRETVPVPPGRYRLEVTVTDENAMRTGLLNRIRNKHRAGEAKGWVEARDFGGEELSLSDLTLIRGWQAAGEGAVFGRHGVDFDPNPSRLYGLVLPMARFYVEVYAGADYREGDTFLLQSQVVDAGGVPLLERTSRATPPGELFVVAEQLPLTERVTAGAYSLDLTVLDERTRRTVRARRGFDVIWSVGSWDKDPDALMQEMALIMTDAEYSKLRDLGPGAREVYLAEYWHDLDPDPTTPDNEVLETFRNRVRVADREFASTLTRGILTDRGRVFVRYGPPDDILYEYSSSGFGLDGSGQRVADPAERATLRSRPSTSYLDTDEFLEGDVSDLTTQRGGANVKSKQLEIWTYDGTGRPLTEHVDRGTDSHRGLKFVFADEMGNGNYTLIGSSGATIY